MVSKVVKKFGQVRDNFTKDCHGISPLHILLIVTDQTKSGEVAADNLIVNRLFRNILKSIAPFRSAFNSQTQRR